MANWIDFCFLFFFFFFKSPPFHPFFFFLSCLSFPESAMWDQERKLSSRGEGSAYYCQQQHSCILSPPPTPGHVTTYDEILLFSHFVPSFSFLSFLFFFLILFLFLLPPPTLFLCLFTPYICSVPAKPLLPQTLFLRLLTPYTFQWPPRRPRIISLLTIPPSLPIEPPLFSFLYLLTSPLSPPCFSYCSPHFLPTLLFYKILIDLLRNHILQQSNS